MSKTKRRLVMGMPFVGMESSALGYLVRPGWWVGQGGAQQECAVIVQERHQGPMGRTTVFKMIVEPFAVDTVRDGLARWQVADTAGTLSRLFPNERSDQQAP